jgi:tRNA threonylcarbamoyladenosine biosynthesis protein TsaB
MQRDFHHGLLMLLLALDTTTAAGSVALWRDGLIEERAGDPGRSHAERLPGDLVAILGAHGLRPRDVERYAVAAGPGSFTGLRIGIATIQGLALVGDRLVHAVGTLELLAHDAARAGDAAAGATIVAWMEAYRGEVFAARYRVVRAAPHGAAGPAGDRVRGAAILDVLDPPTVSAPEPLARSWATSGAGRVIVTGDGVARTQPILGACFGADAVLRGPAPLAGTLAALAATRSDAATRPHAVVPIYVRRPDAELARDRAAVRPTA